MTTSPQERTAATPTAVQTDGLAPVGPSGRPPSVSLAGDRGEGPHAAAGTAGHQSAAPAASSPRTWVIELPPGLKMLSLNGRYHWSERNRRNAAIRKATWALALNAKIPRLERVSVTVTYQPPDRHRRDADNIAMAAKAAIDGISAAGVVEGDWSEHVTEVVCRIGERYPKGRLVIAITEAPGGAP